MGDVMEGGEGQPLNPAHQEKSYPQYFDGVAGWLGLLVASLIVLGPVLSIVTTALSLADTERLYPGVQYSPLWKDAQIITWTSVGAYCFVSIYAGVRLLRKHVPSSVGIAIICLWLAGPLLAIAGLIALNQAGADTDAADAGAALGRPIVWATLWTLYLVFSKRVRTTYFRGASLKSALKGRWSAATRRSRQLIFFSLCWVIGSFLYFHIVAPLVAYPEPGEVKRMWAIILLPPFLLWAGAWSYSHFVGTED
jgi:uncharacterized protein DUF2569